MASKKNTSAFEDLLEIASLLPWKVSAGLAVISYVLLHHVATMPNVAPTQPNALGDYLSRQMYISFSLFFQYIVPACFLIGAAISAFNRKHRAHLVETQSGLEALRKMPWQDFELLVGEVFRRQGYTVNEHGGAAPDGGIDLVLRRDGTTTVVQCKRWKSYSINVSLVRELYGVMTAEHADQCIFVTSGTYTIDAMTFAKGKPIRLIDGTELVRLIQAIQRGKNSNMHSSSRIEQPAYVETDPWSAGDQIEKEKAIESMTPSCPACGSRMVRRVAKKGANVGNEFWGCSRFPSCKGTSI